MSGYKPINFDELHEDLMEHQANLKSIKEGADDVAARELMKAKNAGLNQTIHKKLQKMLMDGKGDAVIAALKKSGNIKEASDASAIIDELISTSFGGDNESQMKAVQLLKGLATSDDPASNAFMKKLDAFTSKMAKSESTGFERKGSMAVRKPAKALARIVKSKYPDLSDEILNQLKIGNLNKLGLTQGEFERIAAPEKIKRDELIKLFLKESVLAESIKSELDGLGADSIKRAGKLMTLMFKSGDAGDIKSKAKAALKSFTDKIKHIGTEKSGSGIALEIELN